MRAVIAHISDLHYGNHDERVESALRADLRREPKPDFIVVTGDLSQLQREPQFEQAKAFLRAVVSELSDADHAVRVIVIPGNHDVSVFKRRLAWETAFGDWEVGGITGACRPGDLVNYFGKSSKGDHATAVKWAKEAWSYCEYYPECRTAFLKFDSNKLSPAPWDRFSLSWVYRNYARGRVGLEQIEQMKTVLGRYHEAFPAGTNEPPFQDARKIALVHHHIHYLPNVGSDSILLMLDAGPFWRTMIDLGVELILHGHKHYATHAVIRYMAQAEAGREQRELMVLSAGTALSRDRPEGRNKYYRLEADALSCRVQQRTMGDVRFEADGPVIVFRRNIDIKVPGAEYPIDGAALDAILAPDEADYVSNLGIEEMIYEGTIDKDLGYSMKVTYAGILLWGESFLTVPFVVVNAPAHESTLAPVVKDLLAGPDQTIRGFEVKRHPSNVRKLMIRIPLPTANPGDRFKISLQASAPAMMYDREDFDAVGLLHYRYGPNTFSYVLRSEREFVGARCFAVHRIGLRPLPILRDSNGLYVVRPHIDSVDALGCGVLCHYRRLLPMGRTGDRSRDEGGARTGERPTSASVQHSSSTELRAEERVPQGTRTDPVPMATEAERYRRLYDFLMASFTPRQFEIFLIIRGFQDVANSVNRDVDARQYFFEVAGALRRRGLITAEFFDRLREELPAKAAEITSLEAFWLDGMGRA
jgi:3',5'-cyclic AMP phosphodiesterase CpdA